jgi:hypothetical protein
MQDTRNVWNAHAYLTSVSYVNALEKAHVHGPETLLVVQSLRRESMGLLILVISFSTIWNILPRGIHYRGLRYSALKANYNLRLN